MSDQQRKRVESALAECRLGDASAAETSDGPGAAPPSPIHQNPDLPGHWCMPFLFSSKIYLKREHQDAERLKLRFKFLRQLAAVIWLPGWRG